jgi:hypothetical protein
MNPEKRRRVREGTLCSGPSLPENEAMWGLGAVGGVGAVEKSGIIFKQVMVIPLENCSGSRLLQQRVRILARVPARVDETVIGVELRHGCMCCSSNAHASDLRDAG